MFDRNNKLFVYHKSNLKLKLCLNINNKLSFNMQLLFEGTKNPEVDVSIQIRIQHIIMKYK